MNILTIMGSPRKNGDNVKITTAIAEAAAKNGHHTDTVFLYDLNFKGCTACDACKDGRVEFCTQEDDFTRMIPQILAADCIVFASPIYMGHVTGEIKTFIDRWCCFFDDEFEVHHVTGKKFIVVTTSAAPPNQFSGVPQYLKSMFEGFFKMVPAGDIHAGDLYGPLHESSREAAIVRATEIGKSL